MKRFSPDLPHLYLRGKNFVFRLAIPVHLRGLAGKSEFKVSLKTKDRLTALRKYGEIEPYYQNLMEKLRAGETLTSASDLSYEEIVQMASIQGRTYNPIDQLIQNPAKFMQTHSEWSKAGKPQGPELQSYFGTATSTIRLSGLVAFYEEDQVHLLSSYKGRERSKKITPLQNAVKQLSAFLGKDIELESLTRQQARDFHNSLKAKIASQKIKANTASKYITHMRVLIKTYKLAHDDESETVFDGLNFMVNDNARPPFSIDFLNERWFKDDAFAELNPCAKALLFAVIDTGCSFKELCGLNSDQDIKLTAAVPHIIIQENQNRQLKTTHRKRVIPLVGYSLRSFQAFPQGFTHYATGNGPSNASGLINKFMKNNGLLETNEHTVYSLRHTFKDRMRKHRLPEELQNDLMGHKAQGMGAHYGNGHSLEDTVTFMQQMVHDWKYF
ncbi:MAG: phage integrase SAM-like domain-containing protein [Brucellaceae bacterium]|nr:phage integrase SAM-like domain-containing protein [Brucellaceae bacterium]